MYENPNNLVAERLRKRQELLASGIDPYPVVAYAPSHTVVEIRREADAIASAAAHVKVAGRIVGRREMGKVIFIDLLDDGARIQAFIDRQRVEERTWGMIGLLDIGDFIGVEGKIFYTRRGELSVMADTAAVLGKASHPIPLPKQQGDRVFDAVTDKGTLYRHRHIDLLCNPLSRDIFVKRSRIISGIRRYLDEAGFIEVETPIVGQAYGGAAARPFVTTANALDQQMFLRISPECALKRVLCGGMNRVYELGKNFRNEGIDASHNPEFTMVEWYEAYSDYLGQMVRFENLVAQLCDEINGTTRITYRGRLLDLTPPWRRLPMLDALRETAGIDLGSSSADDMAAIFAEHHPDGKDGLLFKSMQRLRELVGDGNLRELLKTLDPSVVVLDRVDVALLLQEQFGLLPSRPHLAVPREGVAIDLGEDTGLFQQRNELSPCTLGLGVEPGRAGRAA